MAMTLRASILWLAVSLILSAFLPTSDISLIAAPLVMLFYNAPQSWLYWLALFSGVLLDVIEMSPRLGFLGLSYLTAAYFVYPWRVYFFKDSKITLPVMTFLFTFILTIAECFISLFFDVPGFHLKMRDLLLQPASTVAASIVVFMLPTFLWQLYRVYKRPRRCSDDP